MTDTPDETPEDITGEYVAPDETQDEEAPHDDLAVGVDE